MLLHSRARCHGATFVLVAALLVPTGCAARTQATRAGLEAVRPGALIRLRATGDTVGGWREGRVVAVTADSLTLRREEISGEPQESLALARVGVLQVHRRMGARTPMLWCLGTALVGFVALEGFVSSAADSHDPGVMAALSMLIACPVGLTIGAIRAGNGAWEPVALPPP